MPARPTMPTIKVQFERPGHGLGYVHVPANDLEAARRLVATLLEHVPEDAIWTTEPHTPGILPPDKEVDHRGKD